MTARSGTLAVQSLVSGRVVDGLTGEAPRVAPTLRMIDRDDPELGEVPLAKKVTSDGRYSFYGDPDTAFPRIGAIQYRLRVEAEAPHFAAAAADVDVGPVAGQPAPTAIAIPGEPPATVNLFAAGLPLVVPDLALAPAPVALDGRVVDRATGAGIAGAAVEIDPPGPAEVTDAQGRFTVAALPVAVSVVVEVTAAGFETESITHLVAYGRERNSLVVALQQEAP